jgi:NTE family protein
MWGARVFARMRSCALVLGGGGVVGIAWETGVLIGLRDDGADVSDADLVVGTSAGATVGTQLAAGRDLDELLAVQLGPSDGRQEALMKEVDVDGWSAFLEWRTSLPRADQSLLREIGRRALAAQTPTEAARLEMVEARLGVAEWPERALQVTAVDCETGQPAVWSRESGVSLLRAVASSGAVPVMFPPITIHGRRYYDGGVKSATWADLAAGYDAVVIVAPIVPATSVLSRDVEQTWAEERAAIEQAGGRSILITPDADSIEAFGPNLMDPSRRAKAAAHGRRQGRHCAPEVHAIWH